MDESRLAPGQEWINAEGKVVRVVRAEGEGFRVEVYSLSNDRDYLVDGQGVSYLTPGHSLVRRIV